MTRKKWLEERRRSIGSSDAPVVMGANPFRSRYELWAEKVGLTEAPDLTENEAVRWGNILEAAVAHEYARRTERTLDNPGRYSICRHPENRYMTATLDRVIVGGHPGDGPGVLEIKTTSAYRAEDWEEEPPLHVQIQVQHQLAVTGMGWGAVAALIGGQRLVFADVERNEDFIETLTKREAEFWQLVESETPPETDGSESTARALALLYPVDNGETISLPDEFLAIDRERSEIAEKLRDLGQRKRELDARLRAAIGEAAVGILSDGATYTLRTTTRPAHLVKESTFRVLRRVKTKEDR